MAIALAEADKYDVLEKIGRPFFGSIFLRRVVLTIAIQAAAPLESFAK